MAVTELNWIDDAHAEQRMRAFGIKWEVMRVRISDIDRDESRRNNARMADPMNDDLAGEYGIAMERGDQFPRIILLHREGKKYLIISGNHRTGGADAIGIKVVEAYVIYTTDAAIIDLLPRILNRGHGARQSKEEAIEHAIYAVNRYGYEPKDAATAFGLQAHAITEEIRIRKVRDTLTAKGINTTRIPKTHIRKLGSLASNENVLVSATRLASSGAMSTDGISTFVEEIRDKKTEASQMAVIADYENRLAVPPAPVKQRREIRTKFLTALTSLEKLLDQKTMLEQVQITDDSEKQRIVDRLQNLSARIASICSRRQASSAPRANGHSRKREAVVAQG